MYKFKLNSNYKPKGDQKKAIEKLTKGIINGRKYQTLLGVTGSGKTFTLASVIKNTNLKTLVISHNKTLAAQLFQELREFFPENSVHYFVSYYDYYQPEAYIPETDTYIEKDARINELLDRLRHSAINSLFEREDVIIVASVSCIYGIGSPEDYQNIAIEIKKGLKMTTKEFQEALLSLQYEKNNFSLERGSFRKRENMVEIGPVSENAILRIFFEKNKISKIQKLSYKFKEKNIFFDFSRFLSSPEKSIETLEKAKIYPAKLFITEKDKLLLAIENIKIELAQRIEFFKKNKKYLEAERLFQRTMQDIHYLKETGYCKGIENYERHLYFRKKGEPPYTLIDYFKDKFLVIIDESHQTIPQLKGMYRGDRSRKKTLVEYGFRLPSCLDHRPLKFKEIIDKLEKNSQIIFSSATPSDFEIKKSIEKIEIYYKRIKEISKTKKTENLEKFYLNIDGIAEQIIRPTYLLDPKIELKLNVKNPMKDAIKQIKKEVNSNGKILVLTITKRLAEAISETLEEKGFRSCYLHSEIKTLDRPEILKNLRLGEYDIIVGINLLREGLDLPEVSLIIIFEGDKEGFLRDKTSFIQIIGRAARNINGRAIIYASKITNSIKEAVFETDRRRTIQEKYNKIYNLTPKPVIKKIRPPIISFTKKEKVKEEVEGYNINKKNINIIIKDLEKQMKKAAKNLDFEKAAYIRDKIIALKSNKLK